MTDEQPDTTRPDLASRSLRALRAARGSDTAPADDGATAESSVEDATTDAVEEDRTVEEPAVAESDSTDSTAPKATDDEPPVLAPAAPRKTKSKPEVRAATPTRRRAPGRLTVVSAAIAVAALVFGVVSGVVWWRAGHDSDRATATARDDVALDARLAIATVNTSDYRKPDVALRNWLSVSTGSLKAQFSDQRKAAITLLGQSKVSTSALVLDAAVTKLDTAQGSATVIASVNLKRTPATGSASTTRNRFRATLTRQGDDWKLADLALVPVQLT